MGRQGSLPCSQEFWARWIQPTPSRHKLHQDEIYANGDYAQKSTSELRNY
jgi:hypothetical protein